MKVPIDPYSPKTGNVRPLYSEQYLHFHKMGLLIFTLDSLIVILSDDIIRCQSNGNYCNIYTRNGNCVLTSKTLKKVEEALPNKKFIRVHQSHLVNFQEIFKVNGSELVLRNGSTIPISRGRKAEIIEHLKQIYVQL